MRHQTMLLKHYFDGKKRKGESCFAIQRGGKRKALQGQLREKKKKEELNYRFLLTRREGSRDIFVAGETCRWQEGFMKEKGAPSF